MAFPSPAHAPHRAEPLGQAPGVALLQALVRAVSRLSAELDGPEGDHVGEQLRQLLSAACGAGVDDRQRSLPESRLVAILAHIDAHLSDPGLGAASVAARFDLSPRYVAKLFEGQGATLGETVTARRIAMAAGILGDPAARRRTVAEIAYACGFSDLTTFNRRFRRTFGATPREYRAACGAGPKSPP